VRYRTETVIDPVTGASVDVEVPYNPCHESAVTWYAVSFRPSAAYIPESRSLSTDKHRQSALILKFSLGFRKRSIMQTSLESDLLKERAGTSDSLRNNVFSLRKHGIFKALVLCHFHFARSLLLSDAKTGIVTKNRKKAPPCSCSTSI
jgi:hypothetical protein